MDEINIATLNKTLSKTLGHVAEGEAYVITKRGKPFAKIVPYSAKAATQDALASLDQLRKGSKLKGLSIKDTVTEGRL